MVTMESTKTIEISRRHPLFEAMRFVLKARAKTDTRPILQYIKVETKDGKQFVYAADGYRLHIADITGKISKWQTGLEDGIYRLIRDTNPRVELERIEEPGTFPNVWQLVPDYPVLLETISRRSGHDTEASASYTRIVRAMGKGSFNFKYLEDIDPGSYNHDWKFYFKDATSPLVFKSDNQLENLTAVIMPLYCE